MEKQRNIWVTRIQDAVGNSEGWDSLACLHLYADTRIDDRSRQTLKTRAPEWVTLPSANYEPQQTW
ncbi:hypothetical protein E2C01_039743 [Portunus trituberculatus]|uniref:Uncharacterized protein n=1 Tax=Portunus trituberculatus TaxID=210409 RepID=A0A5B7FNU0_PORTR|nr:hypothetical protein [Portunus trituberculatus]